MFGTAISRGRKDVFQEATALGLEDGRVRGTRFGDAACAAPTAQPMFPPTAGKKNAASAPTLPGLRLARGLRIEKAQARGRHAGCGPVAERRDDVAAGAALFESGPRRPPSRPASLGLASP
ncbi:hypothetical protein CDD83_10382 [Cordyceps sp. RAO-2017]|nr:hypothetical protein CDD83_10382 [Cordyceps sp. RAO-2017]